MIHNLLCRSRVVDQAQESPASRSKNGHGIDEPETGNTLLKLIELIVKRESLLFKDDECAFFRLVVLACGIIRGLAQTAGTELAIYHNYQDGFATGTGSKVGTPCSTNSNYVR